MDRFFKKHPPAKVIELNPDTGLHEFKMKFARLPESFTFTAVEFCEHLRACLDHCGFAVTEAAGKSDPDNAHFPFGPDDYYILKRHKARDLLDPIFTVMRSFKPYKGGNDILWALNNAVGTSKHELLAPMSVGFGNLHIERMEHTGGYFEIPGRINFDADKGEIVLARMDGTVKFEYHGKLTYSICFAHVEKIRHLPAHVVMREMLTTVKAIVSAVESEAKRLGYSL